jgi:iron complex outermembrane recepter protein
LPLTWQPARLAAVAVYGTYAQGFRSGGFNLSGVAAGVAALRSAGVPACRKGSATPGTRKTRGVEFGVKSDFLGGAAKFNASGFYTRIDDAFTFFFVAPFNAQTLKGEKHKCVTVMFVS